MYGVLAVPRIAYAVRGATTRRRCTMKIHPYLNFDGKTEEAFRFYAQALAGR